MSKLYVVRIWIDNGSLYAMADNGKVASYDLSEFKGFRTANSKQIHNYIVLNGSDVHWPDLDEDINLEGMFYDNHLCQLTPSEDSVVYRPLPENQDCVAETLQK